MHSLTDADLLLAWEKSNARSVQERALNLLALADPDSSIETLMALPIGKRDALLFDLRETIFGASVISMVVCPVCGEKLELNFSLDNIRTPPLEESSKHAISQDGYHIHFRLPNSQDLIDVAKLQDPNQAKQQLLRQCLLEVSMQDGSTVALDDLAESVVTMVTEAMAQADPQADVQLDLDCRCGHSWQLPFDICSFFWAEIENWAQRTLSEIHNLASAYSWAEKDILALSTTRRKMYLNLVVM